MGEEAQTRKTAPSGAVELLNHGTQAAESASGMS